MSYSVTPTGHGLGWRRQLPDSRDKVLWFSEESVENLSSSADLKSQCPPPYDQGQLGSCTANAIAGALEFDQKKQGLQEFTPSRLMIYYDERVIENSVNSDAGAEIRDGIKSVASQGACPESEWPYDISKFTQKPPNNCYTDGVKYEALKYQALPQDLNQLKACLDAGFPFVFGFTVYKSFESQQVANTGIVPMPAKGEQVLGGHAVMAVGYDDSQSRFEVRNSWGTSWGQGGYFTMPFAYLADSNLASDFWTIQLVSSPDPSPGPTPGPFHPGVERVSLNAYQNGAYKREVVVQKGSKDVAYSQPNTNTNSGK